MFGKHRRIILFLVFSAFFFLQGMPHSLAALKDTDLDGLTDEAESKVYRTDPLNFDTDGDTIADGQEILDGTNPLDGEDSRLSQWSNEAAKILPDKEPLAWYIGRASGIFAFLLLTVVVLNGLLISTRLVSRFVPPPLNYEMHRFFAWMALITIIGHIASFTFDPFIHLRWVEGLIPFTLDRPMVSALGFHLNWPVALGILALYGILALILSSEFRSKISLKTWRRIHYVSFLAYLLFLVHGILAGTDSTAWWMVWIYSFSGFLVGVLVLIRIVKSVRGTAQPRPLLFPELNVPATPAVPPMRRSPQRIV